MDIQKNISWKHPHQELIFFILTGNSGPPLWTEQQYADKGKQNSQTEFLKKTLVKFNADVIYFLL